MHLQCVLSSGTCVNFPPKSFQGYFSKFCLKSVFTHQIGISALFAILQIFSKIFLNSCPGIHTAAEGLILGTISNGDLSEFFGFLRGAYSNACFIYFDSLGHKLQCVCAVDEADRLVRAVNGIVCADRCLSLRVDVAISVALGPGAVFVPAPDFYRGLGVHPSHFLLFSKEIANCNRHLRTLDGGTLVYWPLQLDKVNCYTTLEDIIQKRRITKPAPTVATVALRRILFSTIVVIRGPLLDSALGEVQDVVSAVRQQRSTREAFRIEVRIAPFQMRTVISKITRLCTRRIFNYFDFDELADVYTETGSLFLAQLSTSRS
ncbi:hypothetical protein PAPHI01_0273 [Pancytospora philotis]|nr:hypothetical protein PAPHI01_0273 [Pancytospora philotis]